MTTHVNDPYSRESLPERIRAAFPDVIYSGPITSADGKSGEDYDEPQALYNELHGKSWLQISAPFIRGNAHGLVLLTVDAFIAFLPAWLMVGLDDPEVAEVMTYTFCPGQGKDQHRMDLRVQAMNSLQKEVIGAFLTFCYESTQSEFLKDRATEAVTYVKGFSKA